MEGKNRKLNRWDGFDYSKSGLYFITICADKRIEWFGNIKNEKMVLNEYGEIADNLWQEIPNHYKDVIIDIYQIMPNHIHGIIGIVDYIDNCRDKACLVPTGANTNNQIGRMHQLLFNIIGSYKSAVSKLIHANGLLSFAWQRSFYDRVIRHQNIDELNNIREYIAINPANWDIDRNNLKSI